MIFQRIASVCFGLAFLMAIVMYTRVGSQYISISTARILFLSLGGIGLLLNLLTYKLGKGDSNFNFFYWIGSVILFIGLTFMSLHRSYGFYIVIAGMVILGISFFYTPKIDDDDDSAKNDLLDDSL